MLLFVDSNENSKRNCIKLFWNKLFSIEKIENLKNKKNIEKINLFKIFKFWKIKLIIYCNIKKLKKLVFKL